MKHFQIQNTLVQCGFVIIKLPIIPLYWSKGEERIVILRLIKIMKFLLLIIVTARPHCLGDGKQGILLCWPYTHHLVCMKILDLT